eukprot:Awhi_evm2s5724
MGSPTDILDHNKLIQPSFDCNQYCQTIGKSGGEVLGTAPACSVHCNEDCPGRTTGGE